MTAIRKNDYGANPWRIVEVPVPIGVSCFSTRSAAVDGLCALVDDLAGRVARYEAIAGDVEQRAERLADEKAAYRVGLLDQALAASHRREDETLATVEWIGTLALQAALGDDWETKPVQFQSWTFELRSAVVDVRRLRARRAEKAST